MGAACAPDAETVLDAADLIIVSLPSIDALEATYRAVARSRPRRGAIVLECSTVHPDMARRLAGASASAGFRHLDVGVIGLAAEAEAGELYFLVGGEGGDVERAAPVLEVCGRGTAHLGPVGAAAAAKVLNNGIGIATMLVLAEAVADAERSGIDPAAFVTAVREGRGAGASVVFDRHAGWAAEPGRAQPPTPIALKDARALASLIEGAREACPMLSLAVDRVEALIGADAAGGAGLVTSAARDVRRHRGASR